MGDPSTTIATLPSKSFAVIISGFPGSMISTWQQAGRAGRGAQKSLVILVAFENQLDQYFMNNPEFFFDKPHENAVIDLNNEKLIRNHLICASNELPITEDEAKYFFNADFQMRQQCFHIYQIVSQ